MNLNSCLRSVVVLASSIALASVSRANVLVVAPSGAPYTTVQAAIDAAQDRDTILVRPGTYAGFTIDGKALSIVADPEGSVTIESAGIVLSLAADEQVSLAGLRFPRGVRAGANAGALRLEALEAITSGIDAWPGIYLSNCDDVAILRCTLEGSRSWGPYPDPPESGLVGYDSNVALYDSQLRGGQGSAAHYVGTGGSSYPAMRGAPGCLMEGLSTLFTAGSSSLGGQGGRGLNGLCGQWPTNGGQGADGGAGLLVGAGSQAWLLDVQLQGGPGGAGGAGACGSMPGADGAPGPTISGTATTLTGQRRVLSCATHVREQSPLTLNLAGQPADLVWIHTSQQARWALDLPFSGVRLVGTGARRMFLGTLPGSGALAASVTFGDLGPGVQAQTWHFQGFFRDTSNQSFHGSGAVVVVLDAAF